jgi:hypothetical protein
MFAHHSRRFGVAAWARRHQLTVALVDNVLSAFAVAFLGLGLGLAVALVLTLIAFEIEHRLPHRRHHTAAPGDYMTVPIVTDDRMPKDAIVLADSRVPDPEWRARC